MRNKKTIWAYFLLSGFLFCNIASAQLPVSEEPHHKVVLENEYVRILKGHIPFRDTTLAHLHAANSVVVFLSKSTFAIQIVGEGPVVTTVSPGDAKYVAYGEKPVNHRVWNESAPMFHFIVIEMLKKHPGNDTCSIISQPGVRFQWQQKLVMVYNLDIAKGKQYNLSKSNCAYLLIDISGSVTTSSSGSMRSLQANGFVFFPAQSNIKIDANNKENVACILLQLK